MDAHLNIKYKQVTTSDNYEEFLKFIGHNLLMRKGILAMSPVFELSKEGDFYVLTISTPLKTLKSTFKPGVEFEQERLEGDKKKCLITFDGSVMTQVEEDAATGKKMKHVQVYDADSMTMTTTVEGFDGNVVRKYQRVSK